MLKSEFINKVAEKAEVTQKVAKDVLAAIEEEVLNVIATNDFMRFDFGKIGGRDVPAKTCRNPRTGEKMEVPAKTGYPYFKASKKAKE